MKNIKRIFIIYGDSWFEIIKFIDSVKLLLNSDNSKYMNIVFKMKQKSIKSYEYIFKFEYLNLKYEIIFMCFGKYSNNSNIKDINKLLQSGGKPDLIFLENNKIILGIEDTLGSQVGNSSLQRMERVDFFITNKIPFLYLTYFKSFDRSQKQKETRKASSSQLAFFEKNKISILYKENQDVINVNDQKLISQYFFNNVLKVIQNFEHQKYLKNQIRQQDAYHELTLFLENNQINNWNWNPTFVNESPILEKLHKENFLFTFSSKSRQKVGFVKYKHLLKVIKEYQIKLNLNVENDDWILINPVMFVQKNKHINKVDPATGEFVFYNNLFSKFKNVTLIYSPLATKKEVLRAKNKLIHHIKDKSDAIIISNKLENTIILKNDLKDYDNDTKTTHLNEDDLDFAVYNYLLTKGFENLYISAPSSSWSIIVFENNKILDISKNELRPDFVFIHKDKKIIILGESKKSCKDLIKDREKHIRTFKTFSNKLKSTNLFIDYTFIEVNSCFSKEKLEVDFNLIIVKVNKNNSCEIQEQLIEPKLLET